jgi:hypothetical protein
MVDASERTCACVAATHGKWDLCLDIVRSVGPNIDYLSRTPRDGSRSLQTLVTDTSHESAAQGKCMQLLASYGVDFTDVRDESGLTRLLSGLEQGQGNEQLVVFVGRSTINETNGRGETAIMLACRNPKYNNIFRECIKQGANLNARDNDGNTVLSLLVAREDTELMSEALAAGADPTAAGDRNGRSLLLVALQDGRTMNTCGLIISSWPASKKDELDTCVKDGGTAMHLVVERTVGADSEGALANLSALLTAGADPLTVDREHQRTPLLFACRVGSTAAVDVLTRSGLDVGVDVADREVGAALLWLCTSLIAHHSLLPITHLSCCLTVFTDSLRNLTTNMFYSRFGSRGTFRFQQSSPATTTTHLTCS